MDLHLQPSVLTINVAETFTAPGTEPWTRTTSLSVEYADSLGVGRDEIRAAVETTIHGQSEWTLDEHWSEFEWGASGPAQYVIDLVVNHVFDAAVGALTVWLAQKLPRTMASIETPEDAIEAVRSHVKEMYGTDEVNVEHCANIGAGKWHINASGAGHSFDGKVESGHIVMIKVKRSPL